MKRNLFLSAMLACLVGNALVPLHAQDRIITVPKAVPGAPFKFEDTEDLFGKAYRWFSEGEVEWAADSLRNNLGTMEEDIINAVTGLNDSIGYAR